VSELMLQQTQVGRVVEKYKEFLLRFPDIAAAAHAPLSAIMVRKALGQLRAEGFIIKKGRRFFIPER
jgi:adenine-specific DNA glycosylase